MPLQAYIEAYPEITTVIIIGDSGGVAEPGPDALAGEPGWNESFRIAVRGRTSSHCVGWQKETRNVEESVSDEKHTIGVMSEAEIDAL